MSVRRAVLAVMLAAALHGTPAGAVSLEDEMGPELIALADEVVAKVVYGIEYENLKPQQYARVIRAWVDHYGEQGRITKRQGALIQTYVTKMALAHRRGEPYVPYAERTAPGDD